MAFRSFNPFAAKPGDRREAKRPDEPIPLPKLPDGTLDRDGKRIENSIPGNPGGESVHERAQRERAQAYQWHKHAGTLDVFHAYFDGEGGTGTRGGGARTKVIRRVATRQGHRGAFHLRGRLGADEITRRQIA